MTLRHLSAAEQDAVWAAWRRGESLRAIARRLGKHLPQRSDFSGLGQADLDAIAAELNGRPRETLGWRTPAECFLELAQAG